VRARDEMATSPHAFVVIFLLLIVRGLQSAPGGDSSREAAPSTLVLPSVLTFSIPSFADVASVLFVTFLLQLVGWLWYGPLFAEHYVSSAFGSLPGWRRLHESRAGKGVVPSIPASYRRAMGGAWLGGLVCVTALRLVLSALAIVDTGGAIRVGLLAALLQLGAHLSHDLWSGSSIGVVLIDAAFDLAAMPLAASALLLARPLFVF